MSGYTTTRSAPSTADGTVTAVHHSNYIGASDVIDPTTVYNTTTTSRYLGGSHPPTEYRSVGRVSTARPRTGVSTLGVENQEIICAVSESRGTAPVVGLAFVNLDTGEAVLSQISDSQTYVKTIHKLAVFNPSEILVVSSSVDPKTKLFSIIEDSLENLSSRIQLIDRRYFAENAGLDCIQNLAFVDDIDSIKTAVSGNYYAVCCFAAALKFIELGLVKTFQPHSLRIKYEPPEGSMMIDLATIRSLELVQNLGNIRSKDCLFGLLNETLTPMGARLLRSNILQPLTSIDTLQSRYAAVEELSTKEDMFFGVRSTLKPFQDVDKILTRLILVPRQPTIQNTEQAINHVIMLKHFTQLITPVREALAGPQCEMLSRIHELCDPVNLQCVQELISSVLNTDTTYASKPLDLRNQRTHAVRSGVNGLLDVARQTYKESINDALAHVAAMAEEHNLPIRTKYNSSRQFYLTLHSSELDNRNLPAIFINVYRRRDAIECQTLDLVKSNQKISDAHNEVLLMSSNAIQGLISNIRPHMSTLFKICEGVAILDMLCSFAHAVTSREYVRPQVSADNSTMAIQAGRHPIRERIQPIKFVPNDIYATPQTRFQIITGCNMSGKSTYIRTVALLTVMAQLGSFVPASYAVIPPAHQLFARISADADEHVEANISTFAAEMREAAFILRNVDDARSLVLVDELGRGTSTRDGLAIALSIAEALVQSRARVWFATHFRDLALILAERSGVTNLHFGVRVSISETGPERGAGAGERGEKMEMLYRVSKGAVTASHYGLQLARLLPLPPDVISHAELVSRALEARMQKRKQRSPGILTARRRRLLLNLKEHLALAQQSKMNDRDLAEWLRNLQHEFVMQMTGLDDEAQRLELGNADDTNSVRETVEKTTGDGPVVVPSEHGSVPRHSAAANDVDVITITSETESSSGSELSFQSLTPQKRKWSSGGGRQAD